MGDPEFFFRVMFGWLENLCTKWKEIHILNLQWNYLITTLLLKAITFRMFRPNCKTCGRYHELSNDIKAPKSEVGNISSKAHKDSIWKKFLGCPFSLETCLERGKKFKFEISNEIFLFTILLPRAIIFFSLGKIIKFGGIVK